MKWAGIDSIVQIEIWKREGFSSDHIAAAYGYTRQGLNKKIKALKEKATPHEQGGDKTADEDTPSQSA